MENSKLKIGVTSTAVALVCAGATYAYLRYKYRLRDAVHALKYLNIKTVTTETTCDEVVQELRKRIQLHRAIGFDCEWVTENGKRQPVALVQLSTFDGLCGLFRLSQMKAVPQSLKDLLEDETVYKVGVAPYDDGKYLQQDYSVDLKSTLDIRHLAELCGHNPGGLANLSKSLLQVVLDKSWRIRCSDWGAETLSDRQISYAAADAHVAIKMFVSLVQEFYGVSWFRQKADIWENLDELCAKYADVNFKTKHKANNINDVKREKRMVKEQASKRYPHAMRKKPLYENCTMQAPDGDMLNTCDSKKAQWYLDKGLADFISDNPLVIRLRFEPSGRCINNESEKIYMIYKENQCVVCGRRDSYIRKNVVPREYKTCFPDVMKEHSSHDVVLLCVSCHVTSNTRDQAVRDHLAKLCNAPLMKLDNKNYQDYRERKALAHDVVLLCVSCHVTSNTRDQAVRDHLAKLCNAPLMKLDNKNYQDYREKKKIRSYARVLLSNKNLPDARKEEIAKLILPYFPGRDEVTQELLEEAANMDLSIEEDPDYESHGQKVTDYFLREDGGLLKLEEIWRQHFLDSMKPKFMPELWSIKHNEERLRVKYEEGRITDEDVKKFQPSLWR
ncbi:3'-5' exonuclease domain-containing protein [Phthorimaea operculella]|nr:3'-5' exonuclease domain-containing protein [Phthorimaea operculella]